MSKKKRHARQKIAKTLVSLLVLLIFIAPVFLCVKWAVGAVNERDPRKVSQTVSFKSRTLDNKTPLAPFQEPLVSLSFDDGWESVYTKAFPILQANGLRTTQFIISGSLDNYSYMSVAQLHAMQNAGTEIASHTITHPDLTTLDDAALKHELAGSKSQLSAEFGEIKD
ncbi:MAG TPA: polysaccharide deacetylase family protein, partial [Methylomirabilota bacterium]|nr:polysaccharide deacetylase family protein [Methylomirabilota bacterium]